MTIGRLAVAAGLGLTFTALSGPMANATPVATELAVDIRTAEAVRISLTLTLIALLPILLICMTPFVRILIALSMIRHAFGMPETPPTPVLIALSLLITSFIMAPSLGTINDQALQPFLAGQLAVDDAMRIGSAPLRDFMLRQVSDENLRTVYEIARRPLPASAADVGLAELTTAFLLHELAVAFKIGFLILLPFLLIDLVVSGILLSLGMMMVPPTIISLPIKVLMFVLIDGWSLVLEGIAGGFR